MRALSSSRAGGCGRRRGPQPPAGGVPDEGAPMLGRRQAVVQQALGGAEVLKVAEVDGPVPLATEVLVRVQAVGVTPVEPVIGSGQFPLIGPPPFILGWDISGVIEDSEGVTRFDVGDEVYGMPFFPRAASAYAQYVTAPSRQLARKPPGLSHAEAAALPLAGLAAWQSLVDTARLAAGQRGLVRGAGGGRGAPAGQSRVHLQTTLPLAEAAKAHQLLESGRTTGKIALTI